jgi:hypothetical protein
MADVIEIEMTPDEFAAKFGAGHNVQVGQIVEVSPESVPDIRPPDASDKLWSLFGSGIPFMDEAAAAGKATLKSAISQSPANALLSYLAGSELMPVTSWSDQYAKELGAERGTLQQAESEYPVAKYALPAVSGAMMPLPAVKTLKGLLAAGTGLGGLYGYAGGEGNWQDRLKSAGIGAGLGLGTSGVFAGLGAGAKAALTSDAGLKVRDYLAKVIKNEQGKVLGGEAAQPALTPEQAHLLRRVRSVEPEKLQGAELELGMALAEGAPLTLTEAIADPSASRMSRFLANYEPTMSKVGDFLEGRTAGTPERLGAIADIVAPDIGPYAGGQSLAQGAQAVEKAISEERQLATKPFWDEAMGKGEFKSANVSTLLENPLIKPLADASREILALEAGVPVEEISAKSPQVAQDILERVGAKIKQSYSSSALGAAGTTRDWMAIKNTLEKAFFKENPELKVARDAYKVISRKLKNPTEAELSYLSSLEGGQLELAGKKLLTLPKEKISQLKQVFEENGQAQAFKDGVRAHIQKVIDDNSGGTSNKNLVKELIGNTTLKSRMREALGDDQAEAIFRKLEREERIFKGTQAMHPGSSTVGNIAEEELFQSHKSAISSILKGVATPQKTLIYLFDRFFQGKGVSEELASKLAETYVTNPKKGLADLRVILPLQAGRYPFVGAANKSVEKVARGLLKGTAPKTQEEFMKLLGLKE